MRCGVCGLLFDSQAFAGVNSTATMSNNAESCPRCGGLATQVMQGRFAISSDGSWRHLAAALIAPDVTRADYEELAALLRKAQALHMRPEDVVKQVEARVPRLAEVGHFLLSSKGGSLGQWIGVMLSVLAILISLTSAADDPAPAPDVNVSVTVEQPSEEQVKEWIREAVEESSKRPSAKPKGKR